MNCQDFEKLALALARNSLLDTTTREQGLIHMEDCGRCAARVAEERALLAHVRAVAAGMADEEPPARVETALLTAFRAQTAATAPSTIVSASRPAPRRTSPWSNRRLAAVAAGILILISIMAIFWRSTSPRKPQGEERAVSPAQEASPGTPKPAAPPDAVSRMAVERPKNKPKRARGQATVNISDEAEVVTRFFILREGENLAALDSLQLVRVELPALALSEVGLPVDPETMNEPVKADVVLGQDGLARAIRFVR
jgi:hypothetical protein